MPHVIIAGEVSAARVHRELDPFVERCDGGLVLKLRSSYLAADERTALIDAVVVEGATRHFLVQVDDRDDGVTVRLYPLTDPEKTDGVRRMVAEVARRVLALEPGARVARTNVPEMEQAR